MTDHPAPRSPLDLTPVEARATITRWLGGQRGLPRYRAGQMLRRLWVAPVESLGARPPSFRWRSGPSWTRPIPCPGSATDVIQQSADGTRKYLWRLADGEAIESVLIPSGGRRTLCISSQAGCALRCAFCATGRMGYRRNLTPFEIAGQVREILLRTPEDKPTNIVFMGMGEPLLNWPAVNAALSILNSPEGFGIGARHITVSTVGILPGMAELARRPEQFRLAISLHATTTPQRLAIMPIEKKYDLEAVLRAAEAFRKRVTFEYVMIGGVNDTDARRRPAREAGPATGRAGQHPAAASRRRARPHPHHAHRGSGAFADRLRNQGIEATVRRSRGLDINAACGQLRVEVERKRRAGAERV